MHAFVHGEAGLIRGVRRHLLEERGVDRETLSVSGYWRRGRDEEAWRADKAAERAAEKVGRAGRDRRSAEPVRRGQLTEQPVAG